MPIYLPIQYISVIDCYYTSLKVRIPISLKFETAFICNEWDRRYFHISKRHFLLLFLWCMILCSCSLPLFYSNFFTIYSFFIIAKMLFFLYHKYFIKSISFVLFCSWLLIMQKHFIEPIRICISFLHLLYTVSYYLYVTTIIIFETIQYIILVLFFCLYVDMCVLCVIECVGTYVEVPIWSFSHFNLWDRAFQLEPQLANMGSLPSQVALRILSAFTFQSRKYRWAAMLTSHLCVMKIWTLIFFLMW